MSGPRSTEDVRALQSPDGLTRAAATYYDPNQIRLSLKFNSAYTGDLHLYALDWDSTRKAGADQCERSDR